ncbi:hypothetical protein Glove_590g50 [Diversispora epigaea]|uniref:Uncharacterized protein n=1 Tax=Diversispora epigaea TaxID=1348612 RepID=A0A397G819_9GLOM|nr:hypothetical protein Glove_590g50 [Diversispora epigaea]
MPAITEIQELCDIPDACDKMVILMENLSIYPSIIKERKNYVIYPMHMSKWLFDGESNNFKEWNQLKIRLCEEDPCTVVLEPSGIRSYCYSNFKL